MRRAALTAEHVAGHLLAHVGVAPTAPVPINYIANRLGAAIVPSSEMAQDGRLIPCGSTATILVRADRPRVRRNFTVAHELAHFALRSPALDGAPIRAARDAFRSEEVLANAVAGALLLPRAWLLQHFGVARRRCDQNLATLNRIARTADVSLGASIVRAREVLGWDRTLLHWTRNGRAWEFEAEAGLWPDQEGQIMPSADTQFRLNAMMSTGHEVAPCDLPVLFGHNERVLPAEVMVRHRDAVTLVSMPQRHEAS